MTKDELYEVIINFQNALDKDSIPNFLRNTHRVRQVLRILKVDYANFYDNEADRCCKDEVRALWEKRFTAKDK